jgi:hypothetical protein
MTGLLPGCGLEVRQDTMAASHGIPSWPVCLAQYYVWVHGWNCLCTIRFFNEFEDFPPACPNFLQPVILSPHPPSVLRLES